MKIEETNEYEDPRRARRDAETRSKEKGAAPHYLRCEWYRDARRCRLSEGHAEKHDYGEAP